MPAEKTNADAVRVHLTGAASPLGAQADHAASLGGYVSSTQMAGLGVQPLAMLGGLQAEFASAACGVGTATLTATGPDTVTFAPPGGSAGAPVTITAGQRRIAEALGNPGQFCRLYRPGTGALSGSASLLLARPLNNALAGANVDDARRQTGMDRYACLGLVRVGSDTIVRVWSWIIEPASGVEIAFETPSLGGFAQTIPDAYTAPVGLTWASPASEGAAIVAAGGIPVSPGWLALWAHLHLDAGAPASPGSRISLAIKFRVSP